MSRLPFVIDASVYVPLVIRLRVKLIDYMKKLEFHILDLTLYEVLNGLWKEHARLHRISAQDGTKNFSMKGEKFCPVNQNL